MSQVIADASGWTGAPARAGGVIPRLFAIDLRSLAALRIALALILITDLWWRAHWLRAHYSDEGVLPRIALIQHHLPAWSWSLHMLSGTWQAQAVLFAIAGVAAVGLLIGWRTRLMAIVSWVMLVSLHTRNPLLLQGGDVLLRCLLFWALFLPLGAVASVDRWRSPGVAIPRAFASIATVALMLQVCVVYLCTGLEKNHPIWTTDHTAIQYALSLGIFCTPAGAALLHAPGLLKALTAACLLLERYGPLLVLIPLGGGWVRFAVVMLFMCFHLGLAVAMRLGPFPYICLAAWLPFVPSVCWDRLARWARWGEGLVLLVPARIPGVRAQALRAALALPGMGMEMDDAGAGLRVRDAHGKEHAGDDALACCLRASPWARVLVPMAPLLAAWLARLDHLLGRSRAQSTRMPAAAAASPRPAGDLAWPARALCGSLLVLMLLWNARTLAPAIGTQFLSHRIDPVLMVVHLDQRWNMFAPFPARTDAWYSAPARTRGGAAIDLLSGGPLVAEASYGRSMPFYADERWRKYLCNLESPGNRSVRTYFAQYLYRSWNQAHAAQHAEQVTQVTIRLWARQTRLLGDAPYRSRDLWTYTPNRPVAGRALAALTRQAPASAPAIPTRSTEQAIAAAPAHDPRDTVDASAPSTHAQAVPTAPAHEPAMTVSSSAPSSHDALGRRCQDGDFAATLAGGGARGSATDAGGRAVRDRTPVLAGGPAMTKCSLSSAATPVAAASPRSAGAFP